MVTVKDVTPASPAAKAGVLPGDILTDIGGHTIRDVLDYRFFCADEHLLLGIRRGEAALSLPLSKAEGEDPGMIFETPLMDRKHACKNGCIFCFIDQLPKGMRESLYFKDDDARLSFLHGNYVTMTNFSDEDVDRIIEMRLSPVNVSIHTTEPDLRVRMMKNKRAGEVLSYLRRFADAGLTLAGQIVLCRGVNDGEHLQRTLTDLETYLPALASVSVVPVGLTDHREGLCPLEPFSPADAAAVIAQVDGFGEQMLKKHGTRMVFCADEWYLKAGLPLPDEAYYEGYPQIDNGVGMLRSLLEEARAAAVRGRLRRRRVTVATGEAAAAVLSLIAKEAEGRCPHLSVAVVPIRNDFFGHNVTVAGLLTGRDILSQLRGRELGDELLIPADALRAGEDVLLDDTTTADLARLLNVPVRPVPDDGAVLLSALLGRPHPRLPAAVRPPRT